MSNSDSAGDIAQRGASDQLAIARAQLEVERARVAALSLFARRSGHDLSNFVTVVKTYAELLLADLPNTSGTYADVLEIHRATDAMIEYMQRIARFARASNGRLTPVLLDDVVNGVVRDSGGTQQIATRTTSGATINVDAAAFADALRELIANASEASPADATIHVSTRSTTNITPLLDNDVVIEAGEWAVVEIADEGAGFSADARRDVFDPFVTTKNGVRGAGFGLALVRGVVWHAGGQVALGATANAISPATQSDKPGGRIRLWLPVEISSPT